MEELLQLRDHLEHQRYAEAMDLLGEMEEMSRDDKVNKIYSFAVILLLHLIKQAAEKRTTRSWDISIWNSIRQIKRTNQRRKAKGTYVSSEELKEVISEAYIESLKRASLEAFGGAYNEQTLGEMVDQTAIEAQALALITTTSE